MKRLIAVCGSDGDDECLTADALRTAEDVGWHIAQRDGVLICGGRSGIMRAACKGAKRGNGVTVGILPVSKKEANEFVDIPLVTGLGHRRNFLVVNAADAVIAIGGRWGTLSEIAFAVIFEKPLVLISGTGGTVDRIINNSFKSTITSPCYVAESAGEAVEKAFELSNATSKH